MADAINVSVPISGTERTLTFEAGKLAPQGGDMKRRRIIGGVMFILCAVMLGLAYIVGPSTPVASGLFFLGGVAYGLAMGMAVEPRIEEKA